MQKIFSTSEMDRQCRDYHLALMKVDFFDEPVILTEDGQDLAPQVLIAGTYLIESQRNRNNAPVSYHQIDLKLALEIRAEWGHDREKAIDMMLKAVS